MAKTLKELESEREILIAKQKKIDEKIKAIGKAESDKKRKAETQLLILYGRYKMMKEVERLSQSQNPIFADQEFLGFLKGATKTNPERAAELAQERHDKFFEIVKEKADKKHGR